MAEKPEFDSVKLSWSTQEASKPQASLPYMFLKQLLFFLVNLHSEYLEARLNECQKRKSTDKMLNETSRESNSRVFPESFERSDLSGKDSDRKLLEEFIDDVKVKCLKITSLVESGERSKCDNDVHFYEKVYCLISDLPESQLSGRPETKSNSCHDELRARRDSFGESTFSLEQRVNDLEKKNALFQKTVSSLQNEKAELEAKLVTLEDMLARTEEALNVIAKENHSLVTRMENGNKEQIFKEIFHFEPKDRGLTVTAASHPSSSAAQVRNELGYPHPSNQENKEAQVYSSNGRASLLDEQAQLDNGISSTQVQITEESDSTEGINLTSEPTTAVERGLYNNYKRLLLHISDHLLHQEKLELQLWAANNYSVDSFDDAYLILLDLDRKNVISSSNLSVLKEFCEKNIRYDLAYLIELFLGGDYTKLRIINSRKNDEQSVSRFFLHNMCRHPENAGTGRGGGSGGEGTAAAAGSGVGVGATGGGFGAAAISGVGAGRFRAGGGAILGRTIARNTKASMGNFPIINMMPIEKRLLVATSKNNATEMVDGVTCNQDGLVKQSSKPKLSPNLKRQNSVHSQDPQKSSDEGHPWLCNHYKRKCYVKFACCSQYWPCHRCHNNKSDCAQKKLKSRDVTLIKCAQCETEQPFNENSQFCIGCGIKFAEYFCSLCKHLTGTDDSPYHCEKCGICRIHGDRSFHCDVCGVCLDVQLRNNHKCRADSAHDECCICLEDAFTGCQILPCSHKVHKECASQMIRSGITRCPICRESFAHKLERRRISTPVKRHQAKK